MSDKGKMVWFDLMTTDTKAAKRFYGELIGWKTQVWKADEYEIWDAGDGQIGGLMPLDEQARKAGAPPNWMAYVAVDDVDASMKQATSLGAKSIVTPQDIPDVGRFAVILDPLGATVALFKSQSGASGKPAMSNDLRHISWAELNTTDWKKAWSFYETMFGWKPTKAEEMGELGTYFMFGLDTKSSIGGMSNAATMMKAPPHWLYYIVVDDCDAAAGKVTKLGGKLLNGPMNIPDGGRIAQCMDPQGAMFGIHSERRAQ